MKKSKRIFSLFAAILMAVTALTSSFSVYAKSTSQTLSCAGYNARCTLTSDNNRSASAMTVSLSHRYPYIYASILCAEYDKKTDKTRYISSAPKEGNNAYSSGTASMPAPSSTTAYYANIVSMHILKEGSAENGISLDLHW